MIHRLWAVFALILALFAGVFSPVRADSQNGRYPNSVYGPYVYQISVSVSDPPSGAKYAYGMFTNCEVYCRSYHYWYASTVNYTTNPDSYNGWAALSCNTAFGSSQIGWFGFQGWTPHQYLSSRNTYLGGSNIIVPGGVSAVEGGTGLASRTYPYGYSFTVWDDNYIMCCDGGEDC